MDRADLVRHHQRQALVTDPIASAVEGILSALIDAGVHLLGPEARAQAVREAVAAQRAQWAAMDPRTASQLADELARRHHEDDGT